MRKKVGLSQYFALIASIVFFVACRTTDSENSVKSSESLNANVGEFDEDYRLNGFKIKNFGVVLPKLFRGARPGSDENNFNYLYRLGVKHIVNLESIRHNSDAMCRKYRISCIEFPINVVMLPILIEKFFDWDTLRQAYRYVLDANSRGESIYFHCYKGSDRTGALASALQIREYACKDPHYDRGALKALIIGNFEKYGFTEIMFPKLKAEIIAWTENPPPWICE